MAGPKKISHKTAAKRMPAKSSAKKQSAKATGRAAAKTGAKKHTAKPATKRAGGSSAKKSAKKASSKRRWVKDVTTDSTHPPEGLFTKSAAQIARSLASKKVSPKGPASGMRMLTYFVNRAGKGLSATRRKELERAKRLLSERIAKNRDQ